MKQVRLIIIIINKKGDGNENITKSLIKIAEQLDQKGRIEEANMIDKILVTAGEEVKSKEDVMIDLKFPDRAH